MSSFFVIEGPLRGKSFEVTELASIGRGETCAVRLDGRQISRIHARLEKAEGGMLIRDNGSRNGIFVNGHPVREAVLRPDDQIEIGEHVLVFDPSTDPKDLPRVAATILDSIADPFGPGDWDGRLVEFPRLAADLMGAENAGAVARALLDSLMNSIRATRGFVLVSDAQGQLKPGARKAPKGEEEFTLSNVIRHQLSRERRAVIATDVLRRQPDVGKPIGLLCAPLTAGTAFHGFVYLDERMEAGAARPSFGLADLRYAAALAAFAGIRLAQLRKSPIQQAHIGGKPLPELTLIFERICVAEALHQAKGDVAVACRQLGLDPGAFDRKLKDLGIAGDAPDGGGDPPRWKSVETQ